MICCLYCKFCALEFARTAYSLLADSSSNGSVLDLDFFSALESAALFDLERYRGFFCLESERSSILNENILAVLQTLDDGLLITCCE